VFEINQATRGYEIRTIRHGDNMPWRGYGIEIVDGGVRGNDNILTVGRTIGGGVDPTYNDQATMRCSPGNKLIADFDFVRMTCPAAINGGNPGPDTVTLKLHQQRNSVFTDAQPPGMTRKRWLTRGTQGVISAGSTQLLYQSNDIITGIMRDDFHLDTRLSEHGFFDGWIAGDQTFNIWIFAARQRDGTTNTAMRPLVKANAQDRNTGFPGSWGGAAVHTAGWSYDFTWGATGATSTVGVLVPVPGGAFEIHVENTSVSGLNIEYALGIRGAL
jgi:hypothetical protein